MSADGVRGLDDIKADTDNLYREESITDLQAVSLRRLIPIRVDGTDDTGRKPMFVASTSVMSPAGAVPIQAPIDAASLEEALQKFPQAIKAAVERLMEEVKELQKQEANRIVVPDARAVGGLGGGQGPTAPGGSGGGTIQLS